MLVIIILIISKNNIKPNKLNEININENSDNIYHNINNIQTNNNNVIAYNNITNYGT